MRPRQATVYVIDDNEAIRRAMGRLLQAAGLEVHTFESADAFLAAQCPSENACVVADVCMPGTSGLELQYELKKAGSPLQLIFVTAQDSDETRDEAIRAGAAAFFVKPVDDQALLDAIRWTLTARQHGSRGASARR